MATVCGVGMPASDRHPRLPPQMTSNAVPLTNYVTDFSFLGGAEEALEGPTVDPDNPAIIAAPVGILRLAIVAVELKMICAWGHAQVVSLRSDHVGQDGQECKGIICHR